MTLRRGYCSRKFRCRLPYGGPVRTAQENRYQKGRFFMGREKTRKYKLRGSLTVEAALLMPVIFLVIFMCLYLTIHIHNRVWIGAYAAEQAVSGHMQPDPELLFAGKMISERSESGSARSVLIRGETVYFTGQVLWSTDASARYEICRPLPYLWKIKAAKRLTGQ